MGDVVGVPPLRARRGGASVPCGPVSHALQLRRRNRLLEVRIGERTVELANKIEALRASEQRALESERRALESERAALDASRSKSTFLANMSHELRTPLNAILGFVQLMERDRALTGEQRENLGVIMRSGEHLLGLINDVLSLSKIEAGRATFDPAPFDLRGLVAGLEEMFRLKAASKGVAFTVRIGDDLPDFALGDEAKLRQVLINLLSNAVKFTIVGSVTMSVDWSEARARFAVADTGPGISPEEMSQLFEAFVQTSTGIRSNEGTGLGLAISRDYVGLMDGDLHVESEVGRGTTFYLEIPLPREVGTAAVAEYQRVVGLADGQAPVHVLVVDDVPENRTLLKKLLSPVGLTVTEATNGREAVRIWMEHRPPVVLMDVRMPFLDGIAATREIRRLERKGAGPAASRPAAAVIVALTASAFDHDRSAILAAGCDDYIPKPFSDRAVFDRLSSCAGIRFRYQTAAGDAPPRPEAIESVISVARLARLPHEHVGRLCDAVTIGDVAGALEVVDDIAREDEAVAKELRALVRTYQFDALLELLPVNG